MDPKAFFPEGLGKRGGREYRMTRAGNRAKDWEGDEVDSVLLKGEWGYLRQLAISLPPLAHD